MRSGHALRLAALASMTAVSGWASAQLYRRPVYTDIRWLGRGGTGVALISDGTAAFYNPGGLGKSDAYQISLLNPAVGANQNIYDSAMAFMDSSPETISEYLDPFMGIPLSAQASYFPYLRVPHFMAGYFIANSETLYLRNPVTPELNIDYRKDSGIVLGGGLGIEDRFFVGASLRYQKRAMINDTLGGSIISDISLDTLLDEIKRGEGWGLNVGAQYRHELGSDQAVHAGVAFEDVGRTTFRSQTTGRGSPRTQATYASAGVAYTGQVPGVSYAFLLDFKNLTYTGQSYSKKIHAGVELAMPIVTVRGGLYQGYWSAGLSTTIFPFLTLDLASYAEELGIGGGQHVNRYYMLGLQMSMELNQKKQRKQKYTLDHL